MHGVLKRLCATGAQTAAISGYAFVLLAEAAPAFSVWDWLFVLAPPLVFALLLVVGLRVRPVLRGWPRRVNGLGNTVTAVALAGTLLLAPVWVLGNLTEI